VRKRSEKASAFVGDATSQLSEAVDFYHSLYVEIFYRNADIADKTHPIAMGRGA
jgi:hypothetical protein